MDLVLWYFDYELALTRGCCFGFFPNSSSMCFSWQKIEYEISLKPADGLGSSFTVPVIKLSPCADNRGGHISDHVGHILFSKDAFLSQELCHGITSSPTW